MLDSRRWGDLETHSPNLSEAVKELARGALTGVSPPQLQFPHGGLALIVCRALVPHAGSVLGGEHWLFASEGL